MVGARGAYFQMTYGRLTFGKGVETVRPLRGLSFFEALKTLFVRSLIVIFLGIVARTACASLPPVTEQFGTASDGTPLHWIVYTPSGNGPWPAVLVIHGGGFYKNTPDSSEDSVTCAKDLANAGFIAFANEYRLAPPGKLAGQVSDGHFPDQTDDIKLAVRTARADRRCNGKVGAVGGSAGGSHASYVAGTGTVGDDRVDVAVDLSGAHDFSDFNPGKDILLFTSNVTNYVGVTADDTAALRAASPAWAADKDTVPMFLVNTIQDAMPYAQQPDMVQHLDALGVTNYKATTFTGSDHAFAIWPTVKDQATSFLGGVLSGAATPTPTPTPAMGDTTRKLLNVSTRGNVGTGDNVLVGGFIITGSSCKRVDLRGIGPSLQTVGVSGALGDPVLQLYDSAGDLVESNDNHILIPGIPNPLLPTDPSESFLTAFLPPGSYTAVLAGANLDTGVGLVELYDTDPADSEVANISTRGVVGTGNAEMIGGFIVGGSTPTSVIVRALGPSLVAEGVTNALVDPVLELRDANGNLIGQNDNWRSDQEQQIIATTIPPPSDAEAAIVGTLVPGTYTTLVYGKNSGSGVALVEAYDLSSTQ